MSIGSSTGTLLLAMPAKRVPTCALRRANSTAGGSMPWSAKLAAASAQLIGLSVTAGASISVAPAALAATMAALSRTGSLKFAPLTPTRSESCGGKTSGRARRRSRVAEFPRAAQRAQSLARST